MDYFDFGELGFPDPYFFEEDRRRMEEIDEADDNMFYSPIPGEEGVEV